MQSLSAAYYLSLLWVTRMLDASISTCNEVEFPMRVMLPNQSLGRYLDHGYK